VVSIVYEEIDSRLHPMAERSVRAHLVLLAEEGRLALDSDGLVAIPPSTA
jgi:hypothetical protein